MLRGLERPVTGLEIASAYVAAAKVKGGDRHIEVAGSRPLRDGVVRDGEVADPHSLAEILHELFSQTKLPKTVRVGIANQSTVMRIVELPPGIDKREIGEAIRFQMPETIPLPVDDVVFSHEMIDTIQTGSGPRTRVAVVAARRQMIDDVLSAVQGADLTPVGIDLSAFALIRTLYGPDDAGKTVAYLGVGGLAHLSVAVNGVCVFSRVLGAGEDQMASQLLGRLGLARDRAHQTMVEVGASAAATNLPLTDPELVGAVRETISTGSNRIADEVRSTLEFYVNQDRGVRPERLVVSGPGVSIPGVVEELRDALSIDVERRVVGSAPFGLDPALLQVAAGLTISEVAR